MSEGLRQRPDRTILIVTDPMCSWCWGMADEVDRAREALATQFDFDLLLGGINTASTLPVGAYGKKRFLSLWREVTAVTGQEFAGRLPHDGFVYNSVLPCTAVHVVQGLLGEPPFAFVHLLQRRFFLDADDICEMSVLAECAEQVGVDELSFRRSMADPQKQARVRDEFESAREYGTQALPAVLVEDQAGRRLVAGGYVSADVLIEQLARL